MKSTSNQFLYYFLSISLLVLLFGYYFNNSKSIPSTTSSIPTSTSAISTPNATDSKIKYSNIFFYNKSKDKFNIYRYNGSNKQLIFTDSDEKEKILNILGVIDNKIYLLMGSDTSKNLYSISLDSIGKKNIEINNFNNESYAIGNGIIAYLAFSNAEKDFGYKIFTSTLTGSNKAEIASEYLSPFNLKLDNDYLYYTIDRSNVFEIYSINLDKYDKKLIAEINKKPNQYQINKENIIFLSENRIYKYDLKTKLYKDYMSESEINSFVINNEYIYYTKNGIIYSIENSIPIEITSGDIVFFVN